MLPRRARDFQRYKIVIMFDVDLCKWLRYRALQLFLPLVLSLSLPVCVCVSLYVPRRGRISNKGGERILCEQNFLIHSIIINASDGRKRRRREEEYFKYKFIKVYNLFHALVVIRVVKNYEYARARTNSRASPEKVNGNEIRKYILHHYQTLFRERVGDCWEKRPNTR